MRQFSPRCGQTDTWNGLAKEPHGDCPRGTLPLTKNGPFSGPHRNLDSRVLLEGTAQRAVGLGTSHLGPLFRRGLLWAALVLLVWRRLFFFFCDDFTSLHME